MYNRGAEVWTCCMELGLAAAWGVRAKPHKRDSTQCMGSCATHRFACRRPKTDSKARTCLDSVSCCSWSGVPVRPR